MTLALLRSIAGRSGVWGIGGPGEQGIGARDVRESRIMLNVLLAIRLVPCKNIARSYGRLICLL